MVTLYFITCLTVCQGTQAQVESLSSATINVDATRLVRTVDPRISGINTAVWDAAFNSDTTRTLLIAAGVGALRFPGGSVSDEYHWQTNRSGTNPWTWATSFDDFAAVAKPLNAQVFITVNYGS